MTTVLSHLLGIALQAAGFIILVRIAFAGGSVHWRVGKPSPPDCTECGQRLETLAREAAQDYQHSRMSDSEPPGETD